jgi:hypothetical protein
MKRIFRSAFLPPFILIILSTTTMLYFDRPLIRGDGVAYLAWLDTFVRDQDLDLTNQYQRFQSVNTYQITWDTDTQRFVNIFPFGVAFLQAPFYALGGWITDQGWINQNPDYFVQMQGVEQAYSLSIMIGANLMALVAILLAWRIARQFTDNWTAVFLAWAFFIGTPLFYYSTVSPLNSHNPGAFLLTCMIYLVIVHTRTFQKEIEPSNKPNPPLYFWIILGVLAGLVVLVRWQQALSVGVIWGLLAWQRHWKGLLIATIVAAVVLLPLPIVWNHLFLKPFVVPYNENTGESFMGLPINAHRVFLRMLRYSPILALSLLGIPFLARINRQWAILCVAMITLQILVNGSTRDWYDGDSFGTRRMAELYPIYVLLAATLLSHLPSREQIKRRGSLRPVGFRIILVGLVVYSILFIMAFFLFTWTNPLGVFSDSPEHMISYTLDHPNRQETLKAVLRAHVGPSSWSMPGP